MRHLRIASSVIFFTFPTKSRRKTPFFSSPHAGFRRKEFRGKLAIAITANFINRNSTAEAKVEEISGVAFIFNQKFFQDLKEETGGTLTFLQTRPCPCWAVPVLGIGSLTLIKQKPRLLLRREMGRIPSRTRAILEKKFWLLYMKMAKDGFTQSTFTQCLLRASISIMGYRVEVDMVPSPSGSLSSEGQPS